MVLLVGLAVGFVIGFLVGGVGTARNVHAQRLAEHTEHKGLALAAFRAHDASREAWDRAVHDKWASAFTDYGCGPGPQCDRLLEEASKRAEASVAAAQAAHGAARHAWAMLGPSWGDRSPL